MLSPARLVRLPPGACGRNSAPYRARPLSAPVVSALQRQVLVVERELAGIKLSDLLARHQPGSHPVDLRRLIAGGQISVNGEVCITDRRMRVGEVVLIAAGVPQRPGRKVAASGLPPILAETSSAIVVSKPAGVPSVPARSGREPGVHGLLQRLRPDDDLRIVHRLDRDTSGCLILAKGLAAARHFDAAFRNREVRKTYVALVDGVPVFADRTVDAWLGPDRRRPGKVVASPTPRTGFRAAHTAIAVRSRYRRHALLELAPTTGRGHQLRVHLQSIGHPIVGDVDYGGRVLKLSDFKANYKRRPGVDERPLVKRMFLHAERVRFVDVDGAAIAVTAALPEDLAVALRQLDKFSRAADTGGQACD